MDSRPLSLFRHLRRPSPRRSPGRPLGPIGLDFALERLNLLQLERKAGQLRIRAVASLAYEDEREVVLGSSRRLAALLRRARKAQPFRGRRVVTHLPPGQVRLINLRYELASGQTDAMAIGRAARDRLGSNLGEWVVDFLPIRGDEEGEAGERSALVVAAKRDLVIQFLERLRRCGLAVDGLEVGPVAIRRLIGAMARDDVGSNSLVINFARHKTYLSVIWGRRLVMNREVDLGEEPLLSRLSAHLEVSVAEAAALIRDYGVFGGVRGEDPAPADEQEQAVARSVMEILRPAFAGLVEEVRQALIYVSSLTRGGAVEQIYLLGGIARWPQAGDLVHAMLQMPVAVPNPFAAFQPRDGAEAGTAGDPLAGIALATGYALRGMLDHG